MKELIGFQTASAAAKRNDVLAADDFAAHGILGVSALALLLVVGVALVLSRHIAEGVGQVARAAHGLAQRGPQPDPRLRSRDEIGQLAQAFRDMVSRLRDGDQRHPDRRQRTIRGQQ